MMLGVAKWGGVVKISGFTGPYLPCLRALARPVNISELISLEPRIA
jgi:hypothetical protein